MLTRRFVIAETHDDPRTLARITAELASENINIEGFLIEDGQVLILADYPWKALEVLNELAVPARTEELLQFDLANHRGELARVLAALAEHDIRIKATFGHVGNERSGTIFLAVEDINVAEEVLDAVVDRRSLTIGSA